jgi:hypothetical protein
MSYRPGRSLSQDNANALIPTVVDGSTIKVYGTIDRGLVVQEVILLSREERNARYFNCCLKMEDFSMK